MSGLPIIEQNVRAGEDTAADTQHVTDDGAPTYIGGITAGQQIALGRGVLKRVVLTETAAGAITFYDGSSTAGTVIASFKASVPEQSFEFGAQFALGLFVVVTAASKLTVVTGL